MKFSEYINKFTFVEFEIGDNYKNLIHKKIKDDGYDINSLKYWDMVVILNKLNAPDRLKTNIPSVYYGITNDKSMFLKDNDVNNVNAFFDNIVDIISKYNSFTHNIVYPYILLKITELLSYDFVDKFNCQFPRALSDRLDKFWKIVCLDAKIEFIPTVPIVIKDDDPLFIL